jgi:2-polyprenyl-3-methyl-5-hydroxy-6-metoxy-1,4-benzoquinol methylase|tara:strand:- start:7817 stop:8470 length:654 start_codon:yes stop_codon:yes gene_type:complete
MKFHDHWKAVEEAIDSEGIDYFAKRNVTAEKLFSISDRHAPLVNAIVDLKPKSALEIGAGRGVIAIKVSQSVPRVLGVDRNPGYIKVETATNEFLGGNAEFRKTLNGFTDTYDGEKFDVIFNQGVMQHYSDTEIKKLVFKCLTKCKTFVFSVPSNKYKYPPSQTPYFEATERFLTPYKWKKILKGFKVTVKSYSHDMEAKPGEVVKGISLLITVRRK